MSGELVTWVWPLVPVALISLLGDSRTRTRIVLASPVAGLVASIVVVAVQVRLAPHSVCFEGSAACTLRESAVGYHVFFLGVAYALAIEAGTALGGAGRKALGSLSCR